MERIVKEVGGGAEEDDQHPQHPHHCSSSSSSFSSQAIKCFNTHVTTQKSKWFSTKWTIEEAIEEKLGNKQRRFGQRRRWTKNFHALHHFKQHPHPHQFQFTLIFTFFLCILNSLPISASGSGLPQKFAIEPTDRTAIVGETVILPCRVLNKVGTLQWTRDGFGLGSDRNLVGFPRYAMVGSDEENDFSLQISNVQLDDDAEFQCQVGAADGIRGIRSRAAILTVSLPPEPPKIVQGDTLRTTAGKSVVLTCESHGGKPPAELTWLDGDGNPVTINTEYTTQILPDGKRANADLKWTFTASKEHNRKTFACRAENAALSQPQKAHIKIEVKYPPEVKLRVDKEKLSENGDVHFTCEASSNPPDMVFKWYKNNEVVLGDPSTTFTLPRVTKAMNGLEIVCEVTNSVGTTRATHKLDVHYGPTFKSPLQAVHAAEEGKDVKLICNADGNPKPKIIWLFNGSPQVLGTSSELVIKDMTYEKSGKYICRASVEGFPEISTSTLVFIKGPPKVVSSSVQYGAEGETVKVECLVESIPAPNKVQWFHNLEILENTKRIKLVEEKLPSESLIRYLLVIHKAQKEDFGPYNCSVFNEFGHDFMIINLAKQKSFPMLIIVTAIIGGLVAIVSVTIIVILCMKRKSGLDDDYSADMKKKGMSVTKTGTGLSNCSTTNSSVKQVIHHNHVMDTVSSGADSDLKVEIRTSSSMSEQNQCWEDLNEGSSERHLNANEIAQVVENIYSYTNEPLYQGNNKETQNNNGFIPYHDYSRDYLQPTPTSQAQLLPSLNMSGAPSSPIQHASIVMTSNRDSYLDHSNYGTLPMDARYASRGAANSTSVHNGSPYGSSPYLRPSSNVPPTTPTPSVYGSSQRYITSPNSQQVKPGTLATHV